MTRPSLSARLCREFSVQRRLLAGEAPESLASELGLSATAIDRITRLYEADITAGDRRCAESLRARQTLQLEAIYFIAIAAVQAAADAADPKQLAIALSALEDIRELWSLANLSGGAREGEQGENLVRIIEEPNWFGEQPASDRNGSAT